MTVVLNLQGPSSRGRHRGSEWQRSWGTFFCCCFLTVTFIIRQILLVNGHESKWSADRSRITSPTSVRCLSQTLSSGLHGNNIRKQPGPVEALKQMLFRLQAVETKLQRREEEASESQTHPDRLQTPGTQVETLVFQSKQTINRIYFSSWTHLRTLLSTSSCEENPSQWLLSELHWTLEEFLWSFSGASLEEVCRKPAAVLFSCETQTHVSQWLTLCFCYRRLK